jgi:hypothetical protein
MAPTKGQTDQYTTDLGRGFGKNAAYKGSELSDNDLASDDIEEDFPLAEDLSVRGEQSNDKWQKSLAGPMILGSAKSLSKIPHVYLKGVLVDMPFAAAEGFRAMPRLWGGEIKDYGKVTDWKTGAIVAGKSFVQGIGDGVHDLTTQPVRGAQEGGAWGAAKGVATGTGSFLTKTISGSLGLIAYPGHGAAKSLYSAFHGNTGRSINSARQLEGNWRAGTISEEYRLSALEQYRQVATA